MKVAPNVEMNLLAKFITTLKDLNIPRGKVASIIENDYHVNSDMVDKMMIRHYDYAGCLFGRLKWKEVLEGLGITDDAELHKCVKTVMDKMMKEPRDDMTVDKFIEEFVPNALKEAGILKG